MSNMFTKHRFLSKRLFLSLLILAFYPPPCIIRRVD